MIFTASVIRIALRGRVAQPGERHNGIVEAVGSSPIPSTKESLEPQEFQGREQEEAH